MDIYIVAQAEGMFGDVTDSSASIIRTIKKTSVLDLGDFVLVCKVRGGHLSFEGITRISYWE